MHELPGSLAAAPTECGCVGKREGASSSGSERQALSRFLLLRKGPRKEP